jgi:uncharacterized protein (TIGR03000 family)
MFQKTFTLGATLLVAAALVFLTPGADHAAGRGGGGSHGGGFHGGGFHGGGFHSGGYHGGGYGGGYYRPYGWGYHRGGYGYGPYLGGYGYYPDYDYYPSYGAYPPYSDLSSAGVYEPGYYGGYYQPAPSLSGGAALGGSVLSTDQPSLDTAAHVTVDVPPGARLWFEDQPTTTTGSIRQFMSPPLTPGTKYTYDIKASWNENGREVTQTQKVAVTAGARVQVDFPAPTRTAGQASAVTPN